MLPRKHNIYITMHINIISYDFDPSEGTASVEDQGVGDEVLVQHADEMDA
jgi:hypothetical protein